MFDARASDHVEPQVFTFAGYIGADTTSSPSELDLRSGLALARSHDQVIRQMAEWGFQVTAVSALSEVRETLQVLEAIAAGSPEIEQGDYINFLGDAAGAPFDPRHVFTLNGTYAGTDRVFAGFA